MLREMDSQCQVSPKGTVAPNQFTITVSQADADRFAAFHDALITEFADTARDHATEYGYHFIGPVTATMAVEAARRQGDFGVTANIVQGPEGWRACIRLADGRRVPLNESVTTIGRMQDCTIQLADNRSSRYHAEIRAEHHVYRVVDLKSTNGTFVNGTAIVDVELHDGDEIAIGSSTLRFEES